MKNIYYIALLFLSLNTFAQQLGNNSLYAVASDSSTVFLNVSATGYYGSSIFNNQMIDKFIYGGFIDESLKNKALKKAKRLNYLGAELGAEIYYSNTKNLLFKDWGYYVGLSYHYNLGTQFTKDAYQLIFYGNKILENQEAKLSPSAFYLRDVNQFSFGLNKNNQLKVGLTLSSFNNNTGAEITEGTFYTDTNGNYLNIDIEGKYYAVDTSSSIRFLTNNAMGIGIDFETTFSLKENNEGQKVVLGVKNLGVLTQNSAYVISAKTDYQYNGVEVNSLKNIGEGLLTSNSLQDSLGVETKTMNRTSFLPFEIYFFQLPSYKKRIELIYGFRFKYESAYKAFLYAGGNIKLNDKYSTSTFISHGGYSNFQWGLSAQAHFKKMHLGVNTNNLLGFVSKKAFGKSIGLNLTYIL